jgi:hypothetical protein
MESGAQVEVTRGGDGLPSPCKRRSFPLPAFPPSFSQLCQVTHCSTAPPDDSFGLTFLSDSRT